MEDFVHLHVHSEYSLLDGACRISEIPKRAKECGHTAVALTDHGVMYGAVPFFRACEAEGVKPIIGCEVYVAPDSMLRRGGEKAHHLVLLCMNETGYRNLIFLVSRAFTDGFYGKPRIDTDLLRDHAEGLIALSGCVAGKIPTLLREGNVEGAKEYALTMKEIFGDRFYIELQNHGIPEEKGTLPSLISLARECDIPVAATNDCHYLRREDATTQQVLMCIQTGTTLADGRHKGFETDELYYKTTEEMRRLFGDVDGALENTVRIAKRCDFRFDFKRPPLPSYPCPKGLSSVEYLEKCTREGLSAKKDALALDLSAHTFAEYEERLSRELAMIENMGFSDYFLVVADYVTYAKRHGIAVGPGRGSGAGSLVAFTLGITDVDSLRYDLLFERFLNPERVSMPDIDIDFADNRRDEMIAYMIEKYGADRVSQIVAFGTLASRAAILDCGRAMDLPREEYRGLAALIPQEHGGMSLSEASARKDVRAYVEAHPACSTLLRHAKAVEGMPKNVSVHPAGVLLTEDPILSYLPVAVNNGTAVTQYDMDVLGSMGLLKFDFLSLRYLTLLQDAENLIRRREPNFSVEKIPMDDPETFSLLGEGKTVGLFQLESRGMRQMLTELKPSSFEDVVAAIALYRPGPMDSIPAFIAGHRDPSSVSYDVPELEPILKNTYGVTVYQEQVMRICRELAGFSLGHADVVRRAMAKKKGDALAAEETAFVEGCAKNGIDPEKAGKLFDDLSAFANYAFNKSHAVAYAVISCRTAYLKAHYPVEYMAALLKSELGDLHKVTEYTAECNAMGIRVLKPDVNESGPDFTPNADGNLRFGLLALKNVGEALAANIVAERAFGPFTSFEDFAERISPKLPNRRMVEVLVRVGAFDGFGINRRSLLAGMDGLFDSLAEKNRHNVEGQLDLFSMPGGVKETEGYKFPDLTEFSLRDLLMLEKEYSGLCFSGHLLDEYSRHIADLGTVPLGSVYSEDAVDKTPVRLAVLITTVNERQTKKKEKMATFRAEDGMEEADFILFPRDYEKNAAVLSEGKPVLVEGTLSIDEDERRVFVSRLTALVENERYAAAKATAPAPEKRTPTAVGTPAASGMPRPIAPASEAPKKVFLRIDRQGSETWKKAEALCEIFGGTTPVVFYDGEKKEYFARSVGVDATPFLLAELRSLLGDGNVVVK